MCWVAVLEKYCTLRELDDLSLDDIDLMLMADRAWKDADYRLYRQQGGR